MISRSMKNSLKKIQRSEVAQRLPLWEAITFYLLMDKLHLPDFVEGVLWSCFGIVIISVLATMWMQEPCSVWEMWHHQSREKNDAH